MSRNKSKEERKWKQWKEHEEDLLRQYGMNEGAIYMRINRLKKKIKKIS